MLNSKHYFVALLAGVLLSLSAQLMLLAEEPAAGSVEQAAAQQSAEELMRRAHDARATWEGMPGFAADILVNADGLTAAGSLEVGPDGEVSLKLEGDFPWVERTLRSLAAHRRAESRGSYDVSFADDEVYHPLGRLIKINDDSLMGSQYRIQGDVIREVHRKLNDVRFTITVLEVARNAEGKYLPAVYTVSFWDAESGKLKSTSVVHDEWMRLGRWDVPSRVISIETADGARHVREIRFSGHRLLDAQAAK
jgi:hypothetical protein